MLALEIFKRFIDVVHSANRKRRFVFEQLRVRVLRQYFVADVAADADDGNPEQIPQRVIDKADERKSEHP